MPRGQLAATDDDDDGGIAPAPEAAAAASSPGVRRARSRCARSSAGESADGRCCVSGRSSNSVVTVPLSISGLRHGCDRWQSTTRAKKCDETGRLHISSIHMVNIYLILEPKCL